MSEVVYPKWLRDIIALLPIKSQFVLTGNIKDQVYIPDAGNSFESVLWRVLSPLGFDGILIWDMVDGLRVHPKTTSVINALDDVVPGDLNEPQPMRLDSLVDVMRNVATSAQENRKNVALVIDYASRIQQGNSMEENVRKFFVAAEKLSLQATPVSRQDEAGATQLFNPIFWLANRPGDLPYWLTTDSERIRTIAIPMPDAETRRKISHSLYANLPDDCQDIPVASFSNTLANLTHNMSLNALSDIVELASLNNKPASDIDDAVQSYRVGDLSLESPWRSNHLRDSILAAENNDPNNKKFIGRRVLGQTKAVNKVLDILKRTSVGLTGAQTKSAGSRPRGILFFVGPTGVGKTELAKTIADIVFGDESAYKRFDMSEFSAEHSGDRLIGAPPGYVGFDQGGELTNAVREQPFRVLLFDEVEKAHNKILDKFLQILEDGRLTDGRGETVYFSESLIIFTSNAGISRELPDGTVEYIVKPGDPSSPEEFEEKVLEGVQGYFRTELRRPELLNRLGENIVVFNFIAEDVGAEILSMMVNNVKDTLQDEHDISLDISDEVNKKLVEYCVNSDLMNGGRGIGSKLEEVFINPLSRLLFNESPESGSTLVLNDLVENNDIYELSSK